MHRRRAIGLFAATLVAPVASFADGLAAAKNGPDHVAWVAKVLTRMETIRVGHTRARLLRVFQTEGGLSTGLQKTYVCQECPYFAVDVKFRAVGRPARAADGGVTLVESDDDIITSISRPYVAAEVFD